MLHDHKSQCLVYMYIELPFTIIVCPAQYAYIYVEWTSCLGWLFSGLEWLTQESPVAMVILIKADGPVPLVCYLLSLACGGY